MIIQMVRMIILMGQDDGFSTPPHPTPPHPKWRFLKLTGRSQLLGVPSYWAFPWPGGGGARPWPSGAGGRESGAGPGFRAPQVHATFFPTLPYPTP